MRYREVAIMITEPAQAVPQIYDQLVKPLPHIEQMALARLILAELPSSMVDDSGDWSEQDLRDWNHAGRQYVEAVLGEK